MGNEVNVAGMFNATTGAGSYCQGIAGAAKEKMVLRFLTDARSIILASFPSASIHGTGWTGPGIDCTNRTYTQTAPSIPNVELSMIQELAAEGQGGLIDVWDFHGYMSGAHCTTSTIVPLEHLATEIGDLRAQFAANALPDYPILDSEQSWSGGNWYVYPTGVDANPDWAKGEDWMTRSFILQASLGIQAVYVYTYDSSANMQYYSDEDGTSGVGYNGCDTLVGTGTYNWYECPTKSWYVNVARAWLVPGVTRFLAPCVGTEPPFDSGGDYLWTCDVTTGAYRGRFVWNAGTSATTYDATGFSQLHRIDGTSADIDAAAPTLSVGQAPLLLDRIP